MNKFIIIAIVLVLFYFHSKSRFQDDILKTNYSNNGTSEPGCDYTNTDRPYPSGKVPGSYLGLSPSEKDMLLIKFMDYNGTLSQYQPFKI